MEDETAEDEASAAEREGSSKPDKLDEPHHPSLSRAGPREVAEACAKAFKERGGLAAALQALRSGSPEEALSAAKALGALVDDPDAAREVDQDKGVLCALFQVGKKRCLPFPLTMTACPCRPDHVDPSAGIVNAVLKPCTCIASHGASFNSSFVLPLLQVLLLMPLQAPTSASHISQLWRFRRTATFCHHRPIDPTFRPDRTLN